jgi:hypothetical protein
MRKTFVLAYIIAIQLPTQVLAGTRVLDSLDDVGSRVYGNNVPNRDIKLIIANIVRVVLGFVGIIFVILIIWAGLQWMTSGGNEEKIKSAKRNIVNATVGLIIVLAAYAIAYSITRWLTQSTSSGDSNVIQGGGG